MRGEGKIGYFFVCVALRGLLERPRPYLVVSFSFFLSPLSFGRVRGLVDIRWAVRLVRFSTVFPMRRGYSYLESFLFGSRIPKKRGSSSTFVTHLRFTLTVCRL